MSNQHTIANEAPPTDSPAERFYGGAPRRIRGIMLALGMTGVAASFLIWGGAVAGGFALGALISYANHAWLERMVDTLGERITSGQTKGRAGVIVFRAALRYVFIAAGAYVIFRVHPTALYGFLAGICLTIAAMVCEAAAEIYVGLRHGL